MDVSVVIPVKNGGDVLKRTLKMVFSQKTQYEYEVICVDSGSKDDTLETISQYPIKLYKIPPQDFGHGKTRNYGASKGTGEFIFFITQDACPYDEYWLQNMIDAMKLDDQIAGGFGKHYPYENCNPYDQRDLTIHFNIFGQENCITSLKEPGPFKDDPEFLQRLSFFSDNNACIRRSIWEKYPYADVQFAEDQIWMRQMTELGYKRVYCPSSAVFHSHNFDIKTYYKRYFDEFKGLYEVYQYQITTHWLLLFIMWARVVLSDMRYIRHVCPSFKERCYWIVYSIRRNRARFYGGYKGGMYHTYSKAKQSKLDRTISQQYDQRKA